MTDFHWQKNQFLSYFRTHFTVKKAKKVNLTKIKVLNLLKFCIDYRKQIIFGEIIFCVINFHRCTFFHFFAWIYFCGCWNFNNFAWNYFRGYQICNLYVIYTLMEEKEQILTKLLKIHQINLYNYLFELLKSRIFLLKTEPVLHNIFEKKISWVDFGR